MVIIGKIFLILVFDVMEILGLDFLCVCLCVVLVYIGVFKK